MSSKFGGVDALDLLQLLFIYLKLTDQISWGWWVVLLPIEIIGGGWLLVAILDATD